MNDQSLEIKLKNRLGDKLLHRQQTADNIHTIWVSKNAVFEACRMLKEEKGFSFSMLYDLTAVDERDRQNKNGQPQSEFTLVYHLFSFLKNTDLRIKVPLQDNEEAASVHEIWPAANWYEREVFDMFGIRFTSPAQRTSGPCHRNGAFFIAR